MSVFGDIIGGVEDLIPGHAEQREAQEEYSRQMQELIDKIEKEWKLPDATPLTPREYVLLQQYVPQIAAFVEQQAPQLVPEATGAGAQAQKQALGQLSDLSKSGVDAGMQAQLEEANLSADQALRSSRANALANLAQRGLANSGATLSADIGAGLGAAEQQRKAAVQAAAQAAQRKAQAIEALGNLGSQMSGQEQQRQMYNANTLNQYNQLLANRRQQYQDYVAGMNNQANMYNQQNMQNTQNANTELKNRYDLINKQRQDALVNSMNQKLMTESGMQGNLNQYNMQQAVQRGQDTTRFLMAAAGAGIGAFAGGPWGAAAGASIGSQLGGGQGLQIPMWGGGGYQQQPSAFSGGGDVDYGSVNPKYGLGVDTGYGAPINQGEGIYGGLGGQGV